MITLLSSHPMLSLLHLKLCYPYTTSNYVTPTPPHTLCYPYPTSHHILHLPRLTYYPNLPKDNVKAIFRRAKASAALGDFSAARLGFTLAERLTPDLASVVRRELDALAFDIETKTAEEKQCYSKLFK